MIIPTSAKIPSPSSQFFNSFDSTGIAVLEKQVYRKINFYFPDEIKIELKSLISIEIDNTEIQFLLSAMLY